MANPQDRLPLSVDGMELANMMVNSDLLQLAWNPISALNAEVNAPHHQVSSSPAQSLKWKVFNQAGYMAIAFTTSSAISTTHHLLDSAELVSSETLKLQNFPHFESLCSKGNPSFSIHRAAISLFCNYFDLFLELKTQILGSSTDQTLPDTQLIITGHSLEGSLAALFTLFLLDSINPKSKKLPLCITFGSPLIGDEGLRKAVSERSRWSSCFLHVAGSQDVVPSLFVPVDQTSLYRPFGTFLFCSEVGFACVEDPESVVLLMKGLRSTKSLVSCDVNYYGRLVEIMRTMFLVKRNSQLGVSFTNASQAGIILQLEAIGITVTPEQEQNIKFLIQKLEQRERQIIFNREKAKAMSPNRKLNEVKKKMAYLEWYKKDSKAKGIGYYDSYKKWAAQRDMDITKHKKYLQIYWQQLVEEAERKPQKERAYIRDAWLFAGINYRRMVEPLDIAEYYRKEGNTDYRTRGRSKHYFLLEQWQRQDAQERNPPRSDPINKRRKVAGNLTEDSCFWADVEETIIRTKRLNDVTCSFIEKESLLEELSKFERNVMDQISDSAVSPEIFLEQSSFMTWWNEYLKIRGPFYNSSLANFMKSRRYKQYTDGKYWENDMQMC